MRARRATFTPLPEIPHSVDVKPSVDGLDHELYIDGVLRYVGDDVALIDQVVASAIIRMNRQP